MFMFFKFIPAYQGNLAISVKVDLNDQFIYNLTITTSHNIACNLQHKPLTQCRPLTDK